jgi:F-box protein 11
MSYVNLNDQHDYGDLTQFRERLSGEVRFLTGEVFDIFQDRKDIKWGQQWQERINESLDAVTFLIPIITPSFFKSDACRAEFEYFLKREEELGRGDLILPVYYATCPVLKDKEKLKHDPLAQIIAARQYADWRELRHEPFTSPQLRKAITKIAEKIVEALEQRQPEIPKADAVKPAEAVKAMTASKQPEKESKEVASSSNTFQSGYGGQSIGQGKGAIGTQINYYEQPPAPPDKPQSAPAAKTESPTVVVDAWHRGDYATITEALEAVKAGTRILVKPGWYKEGIVIDKTVEIIGDGERDDIVIDASGKPAVLFKTGNGRVANLTLRHTGGGEWGGVDIASGRLDLEDCDISSQDWACVAIHDGADPRLRRNSIHDGKAFGVFVYKNGQGTLENNEIFANAEDGVVISDGGNLTLRRNRISKNGYLGIWVYDGGGGLFENNDLRGNTGGACKIDPDCEARVQRIGNIE